MVASAHPVAAFIGLTILQRGGNAFDAAIAVAAAEGVVLPMKCGLGGDAFVVPHSAAQYLPHGRAPLPGERWAAPDLARTLKAVAKGGADAFYRGEIAERMVAFLKREGGLFEADDFARQQAVIYSPISTDYRGLTVHETAPPSQGFLLLEQLNILEGYDLRALGPFSAARMHLLIEAKKLAFED